LCIWRNKTLHKWNGADEHEQFSLILGRDLGGFNNETSHGAGNETTLLYTTQFLK